MRRPSLAIDAPEPGDLSQINLFAEQLDLAGQLIRAGGVARGRMALVATDNLAEVLLFRHAQLTFLASEEVGHFVVPRYDQRERQRLRQDFDRRVTLATREHTDAMTFMYPKRILAGSDATIFRVAHRYRNAIYHEDRHNDALIAPLGRLYLTAVGRAWCRAQRATGRGGPASRLRALPYVRRHAHRGLVSLPHTVDALAAEILTGLNVRSRALAKRLASDITTRSRAADDMRRELTRRGLPADTHATMLLGAELRHRYRADAVLVKVQDEISEVIAELVRNPVDAQPEDLQLRAVAKKEEHQDRIDELRAGFTPTLNLRTTESLRRSAARLEEVRDADRLLSRYEALDTRLRLLENCLAWIDREWDQIVTTQEEIARGK